MLEFANGLVINLYCSRFTPSLTLPKRINQVGECLTFFPNLPFWEMTPSPRFVEDQLTKWLCLPHWLLIYSDIVSMYQFVACWIIHWAPYNSDQWVITERCTSRFRLRSIWFSHGINAYCPIRQTISHLVLTDCGYNLLSPDTLWPVLQNPNFTRKLIKSSCLLSPILYNRNKIQVYYWLDITRIQRVKHS